MENSSEPLTGNPQNAGQTSENFGSAGVQSTVNDDVLETNQQSLTVETTGDPATEPAPKAVINNSFPTFWIIFIVVLIIAGLFVLFKLIRESETEYEEESVVVETKKAKKTVSKKKSNKKKSAPNQRRKKVSKNKR